jgi:hypothetical protein
MLRLRYKSCLERWPQLMTEAKHFVPSGYSGLNTSDVLRGSRPQKYAELLWTADPLAEAVMDEFARLPESEWRALLDLVLAKGLDAVPNAPEPLRALFHQLESVPFWVDRDRCNLGGATFLRCRMGFAVLAMLALPIIYSWPAGNKPLALSGLGVFSLGRNRKNNESVVSGKNSAVTVSQPASG